MNTIYNGHSMNKDIQNSIDYLLAVATDPFPRYILNKEILMKERTADDINAVHASKWYQQLAGEQWDDGSWGRFHSMDSRIANKQKFVSTEAALRRARELSLTKDDPMVEKCIRLMERYVRGEETWTDPIEKHHDGGKSHLHSRPFLTAANINLFNPEDPVVKPKRDVFVKTLEIALLKGYFDENAWEEENRNYTGPCLNGWNAYPVMILQSADCMADSLQRQYLAYLWNKKEGIYYISNFAPSEKLFLEDKRFTAYLSMLELLSGFSLFPEFTKDDVYPHLTGEIKRIMTGVITLPAAHPISGHYAESWRDKSARKNDLILRILRVLVKC